MAGSERDPAAPTVLFFFGLGSRYSYLSATQIASIENDYDCIVGWRPLSSQDFVQHRIRNPFGPETNSTGSRYDDTSRRTDVAQWARYYRVPYQEPCPPLISPLKRALYCVAAERAGAVAEYSRAMFRAMYAQGSALDDEECLRIAADVGLDPKAIRHDVESGGAKSRHDAILHEAASYGVSGVPSFVLVHEEETFDLFWGNDRMTLLRDALSRF